MYRANLDSAIAYLKMGQKGLAMDALKKAEEQAPKDGIKSTDAAYLKILTLMAEMKISDGLRDEAAIYIENGLNINSDHADLLFLKAILLYEILDFDAAFVNVTRFLIGLDSSNASIYDYVYNTDKAVLEAVENIAINSFQRSQNREKIFGIVERLSETTGFPHIVDLIQRLKPLK